MRDAEAWAGPHSPSGPKATAKGAGLGGAAGGRVACPLPGDVRRPWCSTVSKVWTDFLIPRSVNPSGASPDVLKHCEISASFRKHKLEPDGQVRSRDCRPLGGPG